MRENATTTATKGLCISEKIILLDMWLSGHSMTRGNAGLNWGQLSKMKSDWLTGMKGTSCTFRAVITLKSCPSPGAWTEHRCGEIVGYGGERQDYLFSWTLPTRAMSFPDSIAAYYCCSFIFSASPVCHIFWTHKIKKWCLTSCTATIRWLDV